MLTETDPRQKLVPLRRFAHKKLYDTTYLSVLVQRKKLKARKVGRVYWTSEEWFQDYLDKHAREEIRGGYRVIFEAQRHNTSLRPLSRGDLDKSIISKGDLTTYNKGGFFVGLKNVWYKVASLTLGALILGALVINIFITLDSRRGIISGVEEADEDVGTSTVEVIGEAD